MCRRVQGSQIFKWNSIILICSKVMAFLVISLSPRGPRGPCGPHIIPTSSPHHPRHPHIIPTSSLSSPHHPHSPQKVPMWYPWLWSLWCPPHVVPVVLIITTLSPSSPHHPMSSKRSPHHFQSPDTHSTHPHPPWGWGTLNL